MHAIEVFCPLVPFYFSNIVLPTLKTLENLEEFYTTLCPEVAENMCLGSQVPDLMFLKAELYKESKNGFKTINFRPPSVMIFSKN